MFGKKEEKCPNFGQILSTLELKMDIVEILLENNEDNIREQFDFCNYKIEQEAKRNVEKMFALSEHVEMLAREVKTLRAGRDTF